MTQRIPPARSHWWYALVGYGFALLLPALILILSPTAENRGVEAGVFFLIGLMISLMMTRLIVVRARTEKLVRALEDEREGLRCAEQASRERVRELETIFAAVTDPLFVYDRSGSITEMNPAAHRLLSRYIPAGEQLAPVSERASHFVPLDDEGRPHRLKQIPVLRILQGLADLEAIDLSVRTLDGEEILLNVSDAPLLDERGELSGVVAVAREVTVRRTLEMRTQEALQALLAMAESLVLPSESDQEQSEQHVIAQRLIELTCRLLGCRTAAIILLVPETGQFQPIAVAGFDAETEQQFWQQLPQAFLADYLKLSDIESLRSGQPVLFDLAGPAAQGMPTYGVQMVLCAPMLMEGQLVGVLAMDYDTAEHKYPLQEEKGLISAIAKISLLVLERERLQEDRTAAQAHSLALQETARRMDEFLSMTSHELRTPLATIKGCTQIMQRLLRRLLQQQGPLASDELRRRGEELGRLLERISRQADVQNRLVGDLLDVSRIQAGKLVLHPARCDLLKIVREAVESQRQISPQRTLTLDIAGDEVIFVLADAQRIGQVLSNYLTNALKFSPEGRPVTVSVRSAGTVVRVAVHDEGPGLLPDEQQRIWGRFEQGRAPQEQRGTAPGLGLGLYICQTIIHLHQGLVGVESQAGQGSTFWFTLPIAKPLQHEENDDVRSDHHGLAPGLQ